MCRHLLNPSRLLPSKIFHIHKAQLHRISNVIAANKTMEEVLDFWFSLDFAAQFKKDPVMDKTIADRFGAMVVKAKNGDYDSIIDTPQNALGVIILLDQFTRNIYRDSPEAFAADTKALAIAKQCVASGFDNDASMDNTRRMFMYLPYMHSEVLADQNTGIELNEKCGNSTQFGVMHKVIIERFGRFPHRNAVLGRESSPEEIEFLSQPNSSF